MKKLLLLIVLVAFSVLFPQEKGTVTGTILDAKTGTGLPGVNILLKGTYYGATTDVNGSFTIKGVNPGSYTLEISLIGYKTMQFTGTKVVAGKNAPLNVKLEETTLTLDQDIVVVGEKPMLNVEETQSKKTVSREDIEGLAVENIKDIVVQQAGVVKTDDAIHIRGGRAYENSFLLDGVSVQDPLAGTGFGLQLSASSIEEVEVITGGYNAEYGQATSGVVNVRTREGSSKYSGGLGYKRDNFGNRTPFWVFNTDIIEANLSGPEPITAKLLPAIGLKIPGDVTFFANFYGGFTDGVTQGFYKPKQPKLNSSIFHGTRFAPRQENNWFFLGKLTYKLSPTFKIGYSYNLSVNINQNSQSLQSNLEYVESTPGFQYEFRNIFDNANVFTHMNQYNTLTLTHTLNSKTFYELKLSNFYTHLRADANGKNYKQYTEPKDFANFPIEYYNVNRDTIGVIPGDGFWDVGNPTTWRDHYVEDFSVKGDITSFFDEKNKFKAGFNMQFQEMQVVDIYKPWIGEFGLNNDIYQVHPALGSIYAQDNINFGGMILNFGLRLDFWFPGKFVDDAVDNPAVITIPDETRERYRNESFGWFGNRHWKGRLSPRLGISHPITDNQTLFFSYGHFSKWPKPQFVYAKLSPASAQSSFQRFGNPNLKPETTVAYELGLRNQFTENDILTVTAYYKDIFDYVNTRTALVNSARFSTQRFITYVNQDYARSRGIEIEYKKRLGKQFNAVGSVTYAIVTGKSSSADEGVLVLSGTQEETIKEDYTPWDKPITANVSLNFYVAHNEALFDFGNGILDDYNFNIRTFFQSGRRYTPAYFTGTYQPDGKPEYEVSRTERYSKIGKNWFWVDLSFEKNVRIKPYTLTFSLEVSNLFDMRNSAIINPATGKAYEYGDPVPSSWNDPLYPDLQAPITAYPFNPARYLTRRTIKFGVNFKF